eukprot:1595408-Rhodomonas_salina.1
MMNGVYSRLFIWAQDQPAKRLVDLMIASLPRYTISARKALMRTAMLSERLVKESAICSGQLMVVLDIA